MIVEVDSKDEGLSAMMARLGVDIDYGATGRALSMSNRPPGHAE